MGHRRAALAGRRRLLVTLLAAAVTLAAGAGLAAFAVGGRDHPWNAPGRAEASRVADAFFAAMGSGDVEHLGDQLDDPATGQDLVTSFWDRLSIASARYTHGPVQRSGGAATVGYDADITLSKLGHWRFHGTETLVRAHHHWRVKVVPELIHPARHAGLHLAREAVPGAVGRIVDRNGAPLSDDQDLTVNVLGVRSDEGLNNAARSRLTAGSAGGKIVLADASGATRSVLVTFGPRPGGDLPTTLDLGVQRAGEAALAGLPATDEAGLVAIDTTTGGVLAAVSHPTSGAPVAIARQFAPGSTFKIVTVTALLASGVKIGTPVDCPPTTTVGKQTFRNAEGHASGRMTLGEAFAQSCNTAIIGLAKSSLPPGALARTARDVFGFDDTQPLPVASTGGTIKSSTEDNAVAQDAIGQGSVEASPLQMASVAAAVASGQWRRPFLYGAPAAAHPLPAGAASALRGAMRAVVTHGTAAGVAFPGEVYGKTGTAEYDNGSSPPPTHAWFVGFRGTVAFAVFVGDGPSGAATAAPLAADFLRRLG